MSYEYKAIIAGVEYTGKDIRSCKISRFLFDTFSAGNACSALMTMVVEQKSDFPLMAPIQVLYREINTTQWNPIGSFLLNYPTKNAGTVTLEACDAMMKGNITYQPEGESGEWPRTMKTVVEEIAAEVLGVTIDAKTVIPDSYMMEYPNNYSCREVLSHVAAVCGGNWIITKQNTLLLVPLFSGGKNWDIGSDANTIHKYSKQSPITGVSIVYDEDGNYVMAGAEGNVFEVFCPSATAAMAKDLLEKAIGYEYQGFAADQAGLSPDAELGDIVTVDGFSGILADYKVALTPKHYADISSPGVDDVEKAFPYTSETDRKISRRVVLGTTYFGTKITRQNGLEIVKTHEDGTETSRVVLNADMQVFYDADGKPVLYFDPQAKKYIFIGEVRVEDGQININDKFVVDEAGNVKMSGESSIYGGKYYSGDPSKAGGYAVMTDTGFEVYNEEGVLKLRLGYSAVGWDYPFVQLGAGTEAENTKGLVKKFYDGLWVGNSAPMEASGVFSPKDGYNGIFFRFSDGKAYIVNGVDMQNVYTGEAIAKFG